MNVGGLRIPCYSPCANCHGFTLVKYYLDTGAIDIRLAGRKPGPTALLLRIFAIGPRREMGILDY